MVYGTFILVPGLDLDTFGLEPNTPHYTETIQISLKDIYAMLWYFLLKTINYPSQIRIWLCKIINHIPIYLRSCAWWKEWRFWKILLVLHYTSLSFGRIQNVENRISSQAWQVYNYAYSQALPKCRKSFHNPLAGRHASYPLELWRLISMCLHHRTPTPINQLKPFGVGGGGGGNGVKAGA